MQNLDVSNFEKAIKSLRDAVKKGSLSDLERDGAIQRFEYTFELAWKMMRKALLAMGGSDVSSSPKPVLRSAHENGLIENVKQWFAFLEARNLSTHIYSQQESDTVYKSAEVFLPEAEKLLKKLKTLK